VSPVEAGVLLAAGFPLLAAGGLLLLFLMELLAGGFELLLLGLPLPEFLLSPVPAVFPLWLPLSPVLALVFAFLFASFLGLSFLVRAVLTGSFSLSTFAFCY
jgi:hypothetical protein